MPADSRPRRRSLAALTVALTFVSGCVQNPNSVFHSRTEFNRDVGSLFSLLIWLGTAVFVFTEVLLIYALWKYRHRPGTPVQPEQVHGNTKLEIAWTVIPAVVLAVIAIPTVRTIFKTQADAPPDALQVEVIGHQWWWEFRYPQYNVSTANEVYLPIGRTVNFALKTQDVLHSFWIPALGGKRDLVNNRTNYLWFTPDSTTEDAFNGFCAEYCGISHANMRFRAFTVTPEQFASWIAHQQAPAVFSGGVAAAPASATPTTPPGVAPRPVAPPGSQVNPTAPARNQPTGVGGPTTPSTGQPTAATPGAQQPVAMQAGFIGFPRERMPAHTVPQTPIPAEITYDTTLVGDAARGMALVQRGSCALCHTIRGLVGVQAKTGPDLTHVGSRNTIAGGLFPNDTRHLATWIKNARAMKPGVLMTTLGIGQYDPILKSRLTIGLTDQQVADIVAYMQALK
ncbi:MAG TPA: cytochrome c oxidase subunit II [Gemmatimonadaceae bacterium]|nr:cytochrome c oxidase subunit II [Gemmatimonadaceae bacterium]